MEHYPETERDLKFLREQYGASGAFECWCVAKICPAEIMSVIPRINHY